MNIFKALFNHEYKELERFKKIASSIDELDQEYSALSDDELKNKTKEFKERLENSETLEDIEVEAFATVREAAYRVIGEKPFYTQLIGGLAIHYGNIAEMKTGEGKTLTSTLPAYLNALPGNGVHIVTVNEYLAERDSKWMGQIFEYLGLTVGFNKRDLTSKEKRDAYACDITYTTNSEVGFDYLRDNMVSSIEDKTMRGFNYAIIDEVDSILIDEARTPLIISGGSKNNKDLYAKADRIVKKLNSEIDYTIDEKYKNIALSEEGIKHIESLLNIDNLYDISNTHLVHFINQALKANYIMKKEIDYIVADGEIVIVDQFTGRLMKGRAYSDGLHQAIEAKESLKINEETNTMASITYQNLFRLYSKLSGMTGTAKTEEEEFRNIYNMYVIVIPTNKPIARKDYNDLLFSNLEGKYSALVKYIDSKHKTGQPILVGTVAVETSELISKKLKALGIKHEVLNAKNHAREAEIIANAGEVNSVTIATNMAGRGTDIKISAEALDLGGLCVIGTERHESRRIDNQLRGRSGRQGDPGESQFFVSFEDELMVRFGADRVKNVLQNVGMTGEMSLQNKIFTSSFETAQKRVEGHNFDIRKHLLKYDDVLNEQREILYSTRNEILATDSLSDTIENLIKEYIHNFVNSHIEPEGYLTLADKEKMVNHLNNELLENDMDIKDIENLNDAECEEFISNYCLAEYKKKRQSKPEEVYNQLEKVIYLRMVDLYWQEHMNSMMNLKDGINLRGYAQENPLQAYIMEGYELFNDMMSKITNSTVIFLMKSNVEEEVAKPVKKEKMITNEVNINKTVVNNDKVKRNDPCPCGSDKKYKQCCGK